MSSCPTIHYHIQQLLPKVRANGRSWEDVTLLLTLWANEIWRKIKTLTVFCIIPFRWRHLCIKRRQQGSGEGQSSMGSPHQYWNLPMCKPDRKLPWSKFGFAISRRPIHEKGFTHPPLHHFATSYFFQLPTSSSNLNISTVIYHSKGQIKKTLQHLACQYLDNSLQAIPTVWYWNISIRLGHPDVSTFWFVFNLYFSWGRWDITIFTPCPYSHRPICANRCKGIRSTCKKPVPADKEYTNIILAFVLLLKGKENITCGSMSCK